MFKLNLAAVVIASLIACSASETDTTASDYSEPIADAGADVSANRGDTITLDGSGSIASDDYALSYTWSFTLTPVESGLDDTAFGSKNGTGEAITTSFTPDVVGTYVSNLTVSDGVSSSEYDVVTVTVSANNLPPEADSGDDGSGMVGQLTVLDGTNSFDPDGVITEYVWEVASHPQESMLQSSDVYARDSSTPSFVPDVAGVFVFSLEVFDGLDWSSPDYVAVSVDTDNAAPIADAGDFYDHPPCNQDAIYLDGAGSYDPEGADLTYHWDLLSAPLGSLAGADDLSSAITESTDFTWDEAGKYIFTLQVNDGEQDSAMDLVEVVTHDVADNQRPVSRIGKSFSVNQTVSCWYEGVTLVCDPCDDLSFELDGTGSSDPEGDAINYQWSAAGVDFTLPNSAWTEVTVAPMMIDRLGETSETVDVTLTVSDCSYQATDTITVTLTCKGEQ